VRVHLSSIVFSLNVNHGLVDETNDLSVGRSPHELDTLESITGDETSATARLGTPCHHLAFSAANVGFRLVRSPETEVIDAVDEGGLAQGLLVLSSGVAQVVTVLETTDETLVGVDLVGLFKGYIYKCLVPEVI
jgi:hypothetical protein